jgi:hypothetical protein
VVWPVAVKSARGGSEDDDDATWNSKAIRNDVTSHVLIALATMQLHF